MMAERLFNHVLGGILGDRLTEEKYELLFEVPNFDHWAAHLAGPWASRQDFFYDPTRDVGESKIASVEAVGQAFVIDSQKVQDGGVQVVDAHAIDHGLVANFVGLAV